METSADNVEPSILGSILFNILFDKYSRNHLISIDHNCGLNLNSSSSYDPIDNIIGLERSKAAGGS